LTLPIIIDTREQRPWTFPTATVTAKLETGDYALAGAEDYLIIERKELSDLIGCIGRERRRFEMMLLRLGASTEHPHLIIEGSVGDVLNQRYLGEVRPNAVIGSLASWSLDHRVRCWFCDDRTSAQQVAYRLLAAADRRLAVDKPVSATPEGSSEWTSTRMR